MSHVKRVEGNANKVAADRQAYHKIDTRDCANDAGIVDRARLTQPTVPRNFVDAVSLGSLERLCKARLMTLGSLTRENVKTKHSPHHCGLVRFTCYGRPGNN